MKKILLICSLLISVIGFSQSVVDRASKANTVADYRWMGKLNAYIPRYSDTTTANLAANIGIDTAGAVIYTYDIKGLWYRQHSPKKWVRVVGDNLLSDNFFFDSTCNCYKIDTSSIINIINNFNRDSAITSISIVNDSTLQICYGNGVCVNFGIHTDITNITNVYWLGGDTISVCAIDTTNGVVTNVCDTITLGTQPSTAVYQNWLRNTGQDVIEFGSVSQFNPSPGLMLEHNTYANTGYYKMGWQGFTVYDAPHQFSQQQSFQIGGGITTFLSAGNHLYNQDNYSRLIIGYTADTTNRSPFIEGVVGSAIGYYLATNGVQQHGSYGSYVDDNRAKTSMLLLHQYDTTTTDAVTIIGAPILGGTAPVLNGALKNYKIATFKNDKQVQHNGYGSGSSFISSDTTNNKPAAYDASGNLVRMNRWPGSGGGGATKYGADFTTNVDSLFLKGAWVNVKDFGATGDGTTDDKNAFLAAIATGKNIFVPQGTFRISAMITLADDQSLFGLGWKSILKTTANDRIVQVGNRSIISGLKFIGSGKSDGKTFQTGVLLYQNIGWSVTNCYFTDFSGAAQQNGGGGIYGSLVNTSNSDGGRISNCYFYNNNGGLVLSQRSEYIVITNCTMGSNTVGLGIGSGNISVTNCNIQNNTTGLYAYDGTNDGHNTISGSLINHNITAINLQDQEYAVGYTFTACMIYYGVLRFKNSGNIKFDNCHFDALDSVSIDNSAGLQRTGCWWGRTFEGNPIPINVFNGGQDFAIFGEVRYDITTPGYWINQQYADTISFKGAMYHTGITPESSSSSDSVWVKDATTGQFKLRAQSAIGISAITADNGLTANTSTNVQLGGTFTKNDTLNFNNFNFRWIGGTGNVLFTLSNTSQSFTVNNSSSGVALWGISTSGYGGYFNSTSGIASHTEVDPSSTNTIIPIAEFTRNTQGTAANGIGGSLDFYLKDISNANPDISNQLISKWTDATTATRTSQFIITGVDAGTTRNLVTMNGNGAITMPGSGDPATTLTVNAASGVAAQMVSTGGVGLIGYSGATYGVESNNNLSSTNSIAGTLYIQRRTTGTPANGIGASIDFSVDDLGGSGDVSNKIISSWTDVTFATRTSQFKITGVLSASTVDVFTANSDGSWQIRPITATAASAITPAEGMMLFVSNTNGTFTSIGFWGYQNGAWHAF